MIGKSEIGRVKGSEVVDTYGHKVGKVGEVYLNGEGEPRWVSVRTGLFARRQGFVPLEDARLDGDQVHVPYDKAKVKDAPHHDPESALTEEEEIELHRYYEITVPAGGRLGRHMADTEEEQIGEVDELPEERVIWAEPQIPSHRPHFEAEGVLLHPDEDYEVRRNQIDYDGEAGRDRV